MQRSVASSWRNGAVCYEVFVRSFYDSNGDGIGDLNGLTQKLDYINDGNPRSDRDLGARCIWLMPVAASPSYHGYDVTNYYLVNPQYGTNDDFKRMVAAAHRRGIAVLVDLVLNHMSSDHPFFQEALRDSASPHRDWFQWSPTHPAGWNRWGGDNWHRSPVRDEYYYGFFWSGMPDLNYRNPEVREEAKKVSRFWIEQMGADGFRLDAVPYLVEENGQVDHTAGTHAFLREYGAFMHRIAPNAFTIGEVSDSTGPLLTYYPDQLDAYFAFDLADAIIGAVRAGSAQKLLPPFMRLQRELPADRWSPFLRNHDQTRTLTELGGDIARAKLAASLLLTLPGLPFVYYGEEIGMTGNKPDERLRTPMQWRPGNGAGFTSGKPWESLQSDSMTTTVEAQDSDPNSLLNLYRRLIHLRAANTALGSGELVPLVSSSDAVAAYLRRSDDNIVLVVANLGTGPLSGVTLESKEQVMREGEYEMQSLLGGAFAVPLRVSVDGRVRDYVPLSVLAPMETYVFQISRRVTR